MSGQSDHRPKKAAAGHDARTVICDDGQCRELDLLASKYTECDQDTDCELTLGVDCCPGCYYQTLRTAGEEYYAGGLVAFSDHDGFWNDHCAGVPIGCDPCVGQEIAQELTAACVAGRCQVEYDGSPLTFSDNSPLPP